MSLQLIRSRSRSWNETTNLEEDDLFQEGWVIFQKIKETYDPEKGAITTELYAALNNHFNNLARQSFRKIPEGFSPTKTSVNPQILYGFADQAASLSQEAQEITKLIFDGSLSSEKFRTPRQLRGRIREHLISLGWNWRQLKKVYGELEQFCKML